MLVMAKRKKRKKGSGKEKRSPKAVNYVLGLPWAVAVYVFLRGYGRPPKTKLPNVILFHCITTNMRKKPYTSNGPDFSSFLYYFIRRKSTHAHKFLHLFGNIFSDLHVGSCKALNKQIKFGRPLQPVRAYMNHSADSFFLKE